MSEATASWRSEGPIRIGVSSCLLGAEVRYDGGHKRDRFLTDVLAHYVEFVPVCPELEAGMGVPRPPVRLVRVRGAVRMLETSSERDHTALMRGFARRRVRALRGLDLCGYVLKRGSPSCGIQRVAVYAAGAPVRRQGRGLFAEALMAALPHLPVEDEARLLDPVLRESFIERVFAYRRLRGLLGRRFAPRELVEFHTAHALQLMAHSPEAYRALGRLVAGQRRRERASLRERYQAGFMAALARRATPRRNTEVLQHMAGHLHDGLGAADRAELAEAIGDYRGGRVPLLVPLTLVRHHARRLEVAYLLGQLYLDPDPKELMLRNHV